jgi:epoxyqueuosine reductase
MVSKEQVVKLGNRLGFEIVRTCSADPFRDYENAVRERIRIGLYPEELRAREEILKDVEVYADPASSLKEAKTIISMGFCYYTTEPIDLTKKGEPHGILARAYQKDVYSEMHRRTEKFAELLRKKGMKVPTKSRIPFKMAAVRAGTGWQGKNSLILTEKFGSWITLSGLIVDAELEPDEPSHSSCGSCQACQRACPTQAIKAPGVINVNRCIDYLTCSTGSIPTDLRRNIGNRLVSCDRCQEVCPRNRLVKSQRKNIPKLNSRFRRSPALIPLLTISDNDFTNNFSDCDFISPQKEYLQRNAIIALGNAGDPAAIPPLRAFQRNAKPMLKEHATWALRRLQQADANKR